MANHFVKTRSKTKLMIDLEGTTRLKKRKLDYVDEPHVIIKYNGITIMVSLCDLDSIVSREVLKNIKNNKQLETKVVERAKLLDIKKWREKIKNTENQLLELRYIVNKLNADLKVDQSARAVILTKTINIGVKVTSFKNEAVSPVQKIANLTLADTDFKEILRVTDNELDSTSPNPNQLSNFSVIDNSEVPKISSNLQESNVCSQLEHRNIFSNQNIDSDSDEFLPEIIEFHGATNEKNNVHQKCVGSEPYVILNKVEIIEDSSDEKASYSKLLVESESQITPTKNITDLNPEKKLPHDDVGNPTEQQTNSKSIISTVELPASNVSTEVQDVSNTVKQNLYGQRLTKLTYPPPFPAVPPYNNQPTWKKIPPAPELELQNLKDHVALVWDVKLNENNAKIKSYELYFCQQTTAVPNASMWKKMEDLEAKPLPMTCDMLNLPKGYKYYFALRAVDIHDRHAPFALKDIYFT